MRAISVRLNVPAPDQVLADEAVIVTSAPPQPAPLPSSVIVPAFETFPESVILPVPVFVQVPPPPTVTAPVARLYVAPCEKVPVVRLKAPEMVRLAPAVMVLLPILTVKLSKAEVVLSVPPPPWIVIVPPLEDTPAPIEIVPEASAS